MPKKGKYEIIQSTLCWTILDETGNQALLNKRNRFRALQPLSQMTEQTWGDGPSPEMNDYDCGLDKIVSIKQKGSRYEILVKLEKALEPGDVKDYTFDKEIRESFLAETEWVESEIQVPTKKQNMEVRIRTSRKVSNVRAFHSHGKKKTAIDLDSDTFFVEIDEEWLHIHLIIDSPVVMDRYTIEWDW